MIPSGSSTTASAKDGFISKINRQTVGVTVPGEGEWRARFTRAEGFPAGQTAEETVEVAAAETPAMRERVLSLWSRHDNIVSPQAAAMLPGAENVALDLIGHVALGFDPAVLDRVIAEITSVRRSRSTAGSR